MPTFPAGHLPAETYLANWLGDHGSEHAPELAGVHVSTDIPSPRPEQFVTLERTGGPSDRFQDSPQVAIQTWAASRWEAEQLAQAVRYALDYGFRYAEHVTRLELGSTYNWPDPESRQARWQTIVDFRTSPF